MKKALLIAVRVYQVWLGPLLGGACRYYPSCSHYAAEAIERHGARRGLALAVRRVLRCHPFAAGGIDLVPESEPGAMPPNAHSCHPASAAAHQGPALRTEQASRTAGAPRQKAPEFGMTNHQHPAREAAREEFAR
jgi:putative membrane protein insertion efficiency factor